MSSIKLKGSTSGDVTITVPAVAGTNTITIPAVTGTLPLSNLDHVTNRPNAKPIITNGNMQVAQRGTSSSGHSSGGGYLTVDRISHSFGIGTWTVSQETDAPTGSGFTNSLKMDCTTANASPTSSAVLILVQKLEGQDLQLFKKGTSNAEKMTISFWVKSAKTGTYIMELDDNDNNRTISQAYTISSADTWEKKVLTFDGDTTGAFGNDNGESLRINWWLSAGSNFTSGTLATSWVTTVSANRVVGQVNLADSTSNDWSITGIQMEVGEYDATTIPPFQHESFGDNLARCQRYYQRWNGDSAYNTAMVGVYNDTTTLICVHTHIVPMRTAATFSISAASDFDLEPFDVAPSQVSTFGTGNEYQQAIDATDTSARTKGFGGVICVDQTDGFFDFDAEL
jgi:hypothetical protein